MVSATVHGGMAASVLEGALNYCLSASAPNTGNLRGSELEIPGHGRDHRKERYLFGLHFQVAIRGTAFLVEIDEIGIQAAISIIDTEYPVTVHPSFLFGGWRIGGRQIQAMIGLHPVLVQPAVFLSQDPIDKIESFG